GRDRGIALNHISYDGWRSAGGILNSGYMTGVPAEATGSKWKGLFLAIIDPSDGDLPGDGGDPQRPAQPVQPASGAPDQYPAGPISQHTAQSRAADALREVEQAGHDG